MARPKKIAEAGATENEQGGTAIPEGGAVAAPAPSGGQQQQQQQATAASFNMAAECQAAFNEYVLRLNSITARALQHQGLPVGGWPGS